MQKKTYLQESLQNGRLIHWTAKMPLKFYIAPFRFYSKINEEYKYKEMVLRAINTWEKASMGKISFEIVPSLMYSQINLDWKRVDRHALGYCHFGIDNLGRLYSAEVQIGLSDGVIHQEYMDENEVYHTILHEIGHALGLGHSKNENDIMYTPHKYGVIDLSPNDKLTLQWLYKFTSGSSPSDIASKYGVSSNDIDDVVIHLMKSQVKSEFEIVKTELMQNKKDLLQESVNIADLKKYNMSLQNIKISQDIRKLFVHKPK